MAQKTSGRFTPKAKVAEKAAKAADAAKDAAEKVPAYQSSGRYTAPTPRELKADAPTKPWVAPVMFALLGIGLLSIILNYVGLLPGAPSNWYLLGGLVGITLGFMVATQLK